MISLTMLQRFLNTLPNERYSAEELVAEIKSSDFLIEYVKIDKILNLVLEEFNLNKEQILSSDFNSSRAKKVFCYLCKKHTLGTDKVISKRISRSSFLSSINNTKVKREIEKGNEEFIGHINNIEKKL